MSGWERPPVTAEIGGVMYALHTDFRDVIDIIVKLQDPDAGQTERAVVAMTLFYDAYDTIPDSNKGEALRYLLWFLSGGEDEDEKARPKPRLMDWQQDAGMIAAGIAKACGQDVRMAPYLHWWSFLAFYACIGEGTFHTVVGIRAKKAKGKKLEQWEQEYYRENKAAVELRKRYSAQEEAEREQLRLLLGET